MHFYSKISNLPWSENVIKLCLLLQVCENTHQAVRIYIKYSQWGIWGINIFEALSASDQDDVQSIDLENPPN